MKIYTFLLLSLLSLAIYGQQTISGTVYDIDTSQPLQLVNIYFPQLEIGSATDETGSFIMTLPNGKFKMIISSIGYETISQIISIPHEGNININLKPTAIEMGAIIISTPFHKLQSENVMKVEQMPLAELRSNGAVTLAEGLTNIPGVESITTGNSIGKPVIRGLSANRVLVYTQGVRLENQQFGDEHGLGINNNGISSVEVIKGPASLLYGSDALGGVIYINPERFATANSTLTNATANYFSNTRGYNTSLGYKASGERFKYLIRGSIAEHSDYNTQNYRVTNSRFQEKDLKAGIGFNSNRFRTEVRYNYNNSKLGIPEEIGIQSTDKSPLLPFQDIDNHILSSKSRWLLANSSFDFTFGYIFNDRKEFEEHEGEPDSSEPALYMKLKTFSYDLKYNLPEIGKVETIIGVQGNNQTNSNFGEEILIPDATTNDIGLLATSHIHFEKVDIQLGVRYDNRQIEFNDLTRNYNSFNGAIGVKTDILNNVTARLNLASGFRAPNLAELGSDGTHEGTNRYEIGNPDLTNEQNYQVDISLEFKNEHIEIFANTFYNGINDYIFLSPDGTFVEEDPVFLYEQNDAQLFGGEFGFHLHPHPIDWLHFRSTFESVTGKRTNDLYLPLIPANSLTNEFRIEFDSNGISSAYTFVRLRSTFAQNNISEFETPTGSYNLLSAGFGGTLEVLGNDLDIMVAANNITNEKYTHHLSRLKPDGIFNMGRNINIGFTYTL